MNNQRRLFLNSTAAGALYSLGDFGFLKNLPAAELFQTRMNQEKVRFTDDIEPLVRLLEETPRANIIKVFAEEIRKGASYREILAALFLAGVRNVQPRPSVGFKFHAVLVVNSAHLASLAAPESDRWLPIFWALDYFKSSQARDVREGDWTMSAVDESKVPPSHLARKAFHQAMNAWDPEAADVAVASLCRSSTYAELFDLFAHFGCRDYRSIGHKAIYVANSFRTLHCIGWRYAEPVLRSLTYALLNHTGEPNPSQNELGPDAAWRITQAGLKTVKPDWIHGKVDQQATMSLLSTLRTSTPEQAVKVTLEMLNQGIAPRSISDALFLSAGEMLAQQPGIISLHSSTATNALQHSFRLTHGVKTRLELLLQNAAFIPHFRQSMKSRGKVSQQRIDKSLLQRETDPKSDKKPPAISSIFRLVSSDRAKAALKTHDFLSLGGSPESLINAARRLVFLKGNDSHDYKFSSAVLEDYYSVSPGFRNAYLASAAHLLPGSGDRDNKLVGRVLEALG